MTSATDSRTLAEPTTEPGAVEQDLARVAFLREGKEVRVPVGTKLVDAAALAYVTIYAPCGDRGICGKCRVQVLGDGLNPPNDIERERISEEELAEGWRLSCQALVAGGEQRRSLGHRVEETLELGPLGRLM